MGMGRGKGIALALAAAGAVAVLLWLLVQDDAAHTGRHASVTGGSDASRAQTPAKTTSSSSEAQAAIDATQASGGSDANTELHDIAIFCTIDGVPGLPKKFELEGTPLIGRTDDPVAGVIRGRYETPKSYAEFGMHAPGLIGGRARAHLRNQPVLIELRRPVRVALRIEAPEEFARHVQLQRYRPFGWMDSDASTDIGHEEDSEFLTIREFTAGMGRYRVVLPGHVVLKEFEVTRGSGPLTVPIDLRRAGWVKFDVVRPAPPKPTAVPLAVRLPTQGVRVGPHIIRLAGPGVELPSMVPNTRRFVHPGDRPLTFTLSGAQLAPHPTRGSITLGAGGTARLEAVGRATAITFDWPGEVNRGLVAFRLPRDAPPERLEVRLYYEVYRFFGMEGTHDYVIWTRGSAPVLLRNVEVEGANHDLGMLTPTAGQTLQLQAARLADPELVTFYATWLGLDIWLGRGALYRASPTAELRGLPAGTIRLRFTARGKTWTHDHVSIGKGVVRLPIELPGR